MMWWSLKRKWVNYATWLQFAEITIPTFSIMLELKLVRLLLSFLLHYLSILGQFLTHYDSLSVCVYVCICVPEYINSWTCVLYGNIHFLFFQFWPRKGNTNDNYLTQCAWRSCYITTIKMAYPGGNFYGLKLKYQTLLISEINPSPCVGFTILIETNQIF